MNGQSVWIRWITLAGLLMAGLGALLLSCSNENSTAGGSRAQEIKDRSALIGGPMAVGDTGDYLLENSRIRTVISKAGISRAFGLFGGSLIDADRTRAAVGRGRSSGGQGFDTLVEMFPLFFLGVVDPEKSEIINDGKDGNAAVVRVTGRGASFVALTEQINNLVTFGGGENRLKFELDYILEPGKNYIKFDIKVTNDSDAGYAFNNFETPDNPKGSIPSAAGIVGLFGRRNSVFIPGTAGYNIRFALEKVFTTALQPPAIPGLVGDFIATRGMNGVNYGIVAAKSEENYIFKFKEEFKKLNVPINDGSILVPLEGSSITACFSKIVPTTLGPGKSFTYTLYLVVGDGSVSSIKNAQLEIHERPKTFVSGQVFEQGTHHPMAGIRVLAYTGEGNLPGDRVFYTEFITDSNGNFQGYVEAPADGSAKKYKLMAVNAFQRSIAIPEIEAKKDAKASAILEMPMRGRLNVTVRDQTGRLVPAKIQVIGKVGDYDAGKCIGKDPLNCMYDPHIGEGKIDTDFRVGLRCSDLKTPCIANGDCRAMSGDKTCQYRLDGSTEYRERVVHSMNGQSNFSVRPGVYRIVASRGIEYEIAQTEGDIKVVAGSIKEINLTVKHTVPTPNAISGDLHVHTNFSHDVSISDRSRIASYVAEGVDYFVTTDHNRIRDMGPLVDSFRLEYWLKTGVGVELTTFEMGHFNAFPLLYDPTKFNGGNPDWFKKDTRYTDNVAFPKTGLPRPLKGLREGIPPGEIFAQLKMRGSLCKNEADDQAKLKCGQDKVIVQINHPRDSIFGYFGAFNVGEAGRPVVQTGFTAPLSREFDADQFSMNFDAMEIFNGNRFDLLWHWKVPPGVTSIARYPSVPNTLMRSQDGDKAQLAYPGAVDDWFTMLNRGHKFVGTGNSDSHNHEPEAGYPRNYLLTGFDRPLQMNDETLVKTLKENKVMMTNGPILEVWAKGDDTDAKYEGLGSTIKARKSVTLRVKVRAASWVDVSKILIYKNGRVVKEAAVPESKDVLRVNNQEFELDVSDGDAWFVVIVQGKKDLWPVIRSEELEPFQISTALDLIQGTLLSGLGPFAASLSLGDDACLMPTLTRTTVPYAITNPIWVDTDDKEGFTADPCRTMGPKGIRCTAKDSTCTDGFCLSDSKTCKTDADCKIVSSEPLPRCISGKCTVDSCSGISCNKAYKTCSNKDVCPSDVCEASKRRCSDGSACSKDDDCSGKGDGLCRYCACPDARLACENGRSCSNDDDCEKGKCESRRFCIPTGCSLGYCMPTYPTCKASEVRQSSHLFLKTVKEGKTSYSKINLFTSKEPLTPKDKQMAPHHIDARFSIRRVKPLFLYFEHKH